MQTLALLIFLVIFMVCIYYFAASGIRFRAFQMLGK